MNDAFPRCAVPGSSCRLLQLEAPGARPVWAVLDAAGTRGFTGEVTLQVAPVVRAYFDGGELYFAERDGDPSIGERLMAWGVVTADDLAAGTVQLGDITHLGRLFERVHTLDRDRVELALEVMTGEVLGEIADHQVDEIAIASYRHHPSGVVKWRRKPTVVVTQAISDDTVTFPTGQVPVVAPAVADVADDPTPTAEDEALVADYEQLMASTPLVAPIASSEPPTQQMEVPEALRILEDPAWPAPPPAVDEIVPEDDIVAVLAVDDEPGLDLVVADAGVSPSPWAPEVDEPVRLTPVEYDLASVIEQVQRETADVVLPVEADQDVDDDIRDAVRQALAEIEAATRPLITDRLSPAAFSVALGMDPDEVANLAAPAPDADAHDPAGDSAGGDVLGDGSLGDGSDADDQVDGEPRPWLPDPPPRASGNSGPVPIVRPAADADAGAKPAEDTPGPGLRRLIGGIRKT